MEFIENGGWHFSYLKTPEEVEKKLRKATSFAHQDRSKARTSLPHKHVPDWQLLVAINQRLPEAPGAFAA